jgi:DNA-binding transcriptional ArsR family regulator
MDSIGGRMGVKHAELKPGRRPTRERTRRAEEAPTYATNHRVRLECLIILHEGEFSAADIAEVIGEETSSVANHLRDLYDAGCIEFVGHKGKGNFKRAVYRAIARPFTSREEYEAMSLEERQEAVGVHLQWLLSESLASYRSRKMVSDESLSVMSDEPYLDADGRVELDEFLTACWRGDSETLALLKSVQDIACRAIGRMAESGEKGTVIVVSLMAFERGRQPISGGRLRARLSKP